MTDFKVNVRKFINQHFLSIPLQQWNMYFLKFCQTKLCYHFTHQHTAFPQTPFHHHTDK